MNIVQFAPVIVLALTTSACGKSLSDTVNGLGEAIQSTDIQREWKQTTCVQPGLLSIIGASKKTRLQFAGDGVTRTEVYYSDKDCKSEAIHVAYKGHFDKKELAAQPDIYSLDLNLTQAIVTAQNSEGVRVLNNANFCSNKAWGLKTEVDLTSHSRDAFCPLVGLPEVSYTTYAVRDGHLFLAKSATAQVKNRPIEIDLETPYSP